METMYFILGMLSIVAAAFVATIVWGIVKIVKHQKQIQNLQNNFDDHSQAVWRVRDEDVRNIGGNLNNEIRAINDQITDAVTQCKSYTDSRFDKLIDTRSVVGVKNK